MSEKHWQMMKEVVFEIKRLTKNAEKEYQEQQTKQEIVERVNDG